MAKTIEQLKAQSSEVKNASAIGENTATRVGQLFGDIVEHVEQYENTKDGKDASQDAQMQSLVSAEESRAKGEERGLQNQIHAEKIDRQTADTYLGNLIQQESSARETADENIRTALANETARAQAAEQELAAAQIYTSKIKDGAVTTPKIADGAVTYEKTDIIAQELGTNMTKVPSQKVVTDAISKEETERKADIDGLTVALGSETIHREQADESESNRAQAKEQEISLAIQQETERAMAAEEANATAIDAVVDKNEEQDQKLSELDGFEYDLSGDFVFSDGYAINAVPEQSNYSKYVNISSEVLCATPNYIDVSRFVGKTLELSFVNVTSTAMTTWGLCFYDADKIPVSAKRFENTGVFGETTCSVVIPVNAVYIRTTFVQNSVFSAKINYKGKINEIQENINEIQENIEPLLGSEKIIEITNPSVGKIINLSGQVSDLSAYNISEPILVNRGDVVKCSFGCEKNTSAICITELGNVTTRKHTLIQAGQGYNVAEYQYIANENCYIEFCYEKIFGISNVSITEASIKDDVKFLEQDVETLKDDVETLKDDVGSLKDDVGSLKDDVGSLKDDVGSLKDDDKLPYENLMVKMLCIGDSLTEGAEGDVDGIIGKNRIKTENYAYYIKLLTRLDIDVEGHSGRSASDFWNGCTVQKWDGSPEWFYGFKDNAEEHEYDFTPYDSFIIWLGTNNGLTDSLDTDVIPFTNYNDFADTETGCYCKIISKIISKVPHAKIFLGNVYASKGNVAETNATLEKIAQLYSDNVMGVVNNNDGTLWLQGSSFQTLYHNNNNNVHFNKVGEFVLAEHWVNGIRRLIKENLIKFKNPILPVADRS